MDSAYRQDPSKQDTKKELELKRIRGNQQRSRARRKRYLQELEETVRNYEKNSVEATKEVQIAAQKVCDENRELRRLLEGNGYELLEPRTAEQVQALLKTQSSKISSCPDTPTANQSASPASPIQQLPQTSSDLQLAQTFTADPGHSIGNAQAIWDGPTSLYLAERTDSILEIIERRKGIITTRSCDSCYRKKVKCTVSETKLCKNCTLSGLTCTYNRIPQKMGPKRKVLQVNQRQSQPPIHALQQSLLKDYSDISLYASSASDSTEKMPNRSDASNTSASSNSQRPKVSTTVICNASYKCMETCPTAHDMSNSISPTSLPPAHNISNSVDLSMSEYLLNYGTGSNTFSPPLPAYNARTWRLRDSFDTATDDFGLQFVTPGPYDLSSQFYSQIPKQEHSVPLSINLSAYDLQSVGEAEHIQGSKEGGGMYGRI